MDYLPEALFANAVWHALQTLHHQFAQTNGDACRYIRDVAPFAALAEPTESAMHNLHSLLQPAESVWVTAEHLPSIPELRLEATLPCLQMALPRETATQPSSRDILQLSRVNAEEMVALTTLAFPGFFRQRTCEMGSYYGVRSNSGELVAMVGERLRVEGHPEISGLCTHPDWRGKGLALALMRHVIREQRAAGLQPWLHVGAANQPAVEMYLRLGFVIVRRVMLNRICRVPMDGENK